LPYGARITKKSPYVYNTGGVQTCFWWGKLRLINHMEEVGVGGKIILKCIFKETFWGMDCIDLSQDRYR
jgi:hypothetical protein